MKRDQIKREQKIIKNILVKTYPGCRTYIRFQSKTNWLIRVIHPKFANQGFLTSISEVIDLLKDSTEQLMIVEPMCEDTWESRRW